MSSSSTVSLIIESPQCDVIFQNADDLHVLANATHLPTARVAMINQIIQKSLFRGEFSDLLSVGFVHGQLGVRGSRDKQQNE